MSPAPRNTAIFWVVGTSTDVGKTTVATALVRCLNAHSVPTLGFKPIAGSRMRQYADRVLKPGAVMPGLVTNSDAILLARASPLTRDEDVDLITPWQLIFYRTSDDTLLIRAGSSELNNVRFFTTEAALTLVTRPDLARLAQLLKLPFQSASVFDPKKVPRAQLAAEVQAQAFAALLKRAPAAVVVEAAGPFLPTWQDCPVVNHIVAVSDYEILLYPRVDARVPHEGAHSNPAHAKQLLDALARRGSPSYRVDQCIVEEAERDAALDRVMRELLAKARY